MTRLGGHSRAKYASGTLIGSSEGRGWDGLFAERWRHGEGELAEVEARDTEIVVMLRGSLSISRRRGGRREQHRWAPGAVWFCPVGVGEGTIRLHGEIRESIHLFLPAAPLAAAAAEELGVDPGRFGPRHDRCVRDPLVEQIARAIRAEMLDPAPAGKMLVETLAAALGVHLLSRCSGLAPAAVRPPALRGALDPRRLSRVTGYIEAHLADELTVERLAGEACLSRFHFARAFKAATGMPPHRYVTDRRIARARALIARGGLPIAEIAAACGFSSPAYFARWFKRLAGATPSDYRARGAPRPG